MAKAGTRGIRLQRDLDQALRILQRYHGMDFTEFVEHLVEEEYRKLPAVFLERLRAEGWQVPKVEGFGA